MLQLIQHYFNPATWSIIVIIFAVGYTAAALKKKSH
jgi:hypothetical protein